MILFLENEYEFDFSYSPSLIDTEAEFTLQLKTYSIDELLEEISEKLAWNLRPFLPTERPTNPVCLFHD